MQFDTKLVTAGRKFAKELSIVNPPVLHASTVLFPSIAKMRETQQAPGHNNFVYGRTGSPTTFALEDALAEAEGGYAAVACPSGMSAIAVALMAMVKAGDHILVVDTAYDPAKAFCDHTLARMGVSITYYEPTIGAGISKMITPRTTAILCEAPGSHSFEMQDIPAIAKAAHEKGVKVLMDNTWATPLYFRPFEHGVDISIQAATKYIVGHSDCELGAIICTEETYPDVKMQARRLGICVGPDDCYLGLRGLRTLAARMPLHEKSGYRLAEWCGKQPEVEKVLHPGLPDFPGHDIWKRDFRGANGLFGVVFKPEITEKAVHALVDGRRFFGIGFSWGGFESLILPTSPKKIHPLTPWPYEGLSIRLHAGLENVEDLLADLEEGMAALRKVQAGR